MLCIARWSISLEKITSVNSWPRQFAVLLICVAIVVSGCAPRQPFYFFEDGDLSHYVGAVQKIEYPDTCQEPLDEAAGSMEPLTLSNANFAFKDIVVFGNNSSFRIGTDLIFCWDIKSCHWLTQRAVQEFRVKSSGKTNSRSSIIIIFIFRIGWLGPNNRLNQKRRMPRTIWLDVFRARLPSQWVSYNTHIFGNLCQTLHNLYVRFVVVKHMKFVRNCIADNAEWF